MLRLCLWMLLLYVGLAESCPTGVQTHIGRGTEWTHFPGFDRLEESPALPSYNIIIYI